MFIFITLFLLACIAVSLSKVQWINTACGIIATTLSYFMSKICINGTLVQQFGGITPTDNIITDAVVITNLPMSYIFLFIALVSLLITIINILSEIKYNLEPDIGDLDFE